MIVVAFIAVVAAAAIAVDDLARWRRRTDSRLADLEAWTTERLKKTEEE